MAVLHAFALANEQNDFLTIHEIISRSVLPQRVGWRTTSINFSSSTKATPRPQSRGRFGLADLI